MDHLSGAEAEYLTVQVGQAITKIDRTVVDFGHLIQKELPGRLHRVG